MYQDLSQVNYEFNEFKRTNGTFVSTVKLFLFPRHEEVYHIQRAVFVDCHVDRGFLERGGRVSSVDWDAIELRSVAIPRSEEHRALVVTRETTTRHPHARARNIGPNAG
jgi:hypothetical protein